MIRMPLPNLLALAGTLPFIACAALVLSGTSPVTGIDGAAAARSYGLVIAAFMSGVHWGQAIGHAGKPPRALLASSNGAAICLWLGYSFLGPGGQTIALIGVFLGLLGVDRWLRQTAAISAGYFRIRIVATIVAIVSLALSSIGPA